MDVSIRAAEPAHYCALGDITAEAYLGDGLLNFGADDPYLTELRAGPPRPRFSSRWTRTASCWAA